MRDSSTARVDEDSVRLARWKEARRIPLTPKLEASAYRDASARELVLGARRARLEQDSTLLSYDEVSHERLSIGLALGTASAGPCLVEEPDTSIYVPGGATIARDAQANYVIDLPEKRA